MDFANLTKNKIYLALIIMRKLQSFQNKCLTYVLQNDII